MPHAAAPTPHSDVNATISLLIAGMRQVLGDKLVGCYLYGSLVAGDFDPDASDIDLLAVLDSDLDESAYAALRDMHQHFAQTHARWDDRIEVIYLARATLRTFRTRTSSIAVISPGEPFHRKAAGMDWLMNWYLVRETGKTLTGPPAGELTEPIPTAEYLSAVYEYARWWDERIEQAATRKAQAYAILTLCRAARTLETGAPVSKKQAAEWAEKAWPEWSTLVEQALLWRHAKGDEGAESDADAEAVSASVRRFVQFALGHCARVHARRGGA